MFTTTRDVSGILLSRQEVIVYLGSCETVQVYTC